MYNRLISWIAQRPWLLPLSLVMTAILLYANTLGHGFTQDDAIVIYNNQFTKAGIQGITEIFSKDSFYGFFGDDRSALVSGGRYRPMSIAFFAVLFEFFGAQPLIYHISNVLFYALLGWLIYSCMMRLDLPKEKPKRQFIAWCTTLFFIAHPIHTEVVDNCKGLDEIFCLMFSAISLLFTIHYLKTNKIGWLVTAAVSFLMALMSKENAIIFVVFIPVICHFFVTSVDKRRLTIVTLSLFVPTLVFLVVRGTVIGWSLGDPPMEMMNNPFIKLEANRYLPFTTNEKIASILLGLGKYIQLLFVPHPLTHDYYPRQFSVVGLTDPAVLASLVMQLSLLLIAIIGIFKKSIISFCILFYYGAISLMSNILFPIGTHISERFLFTAALPFSLILAYFSYQVLQYSKFKNLGVFCLSSLLLLYSIKTISRNRVWKDDFTLFTTDVQVSSNSAKVQNAAGGALIDRAITLSDPVDKQTMLQSAIPHLKEAIKIHPNYKNAHLLLGNAHLYIEQYDAAIASYDNALRLDPYFDDATKNLLIALNEGARYFGSKEKNYQKAQSLLTRAINLRPNDYDANSLMGIALGNEGKHKEALIYFEKALSLRPDLARAYVNKGYALLGLGQEDEAQVNFQKAVSIDPNAMNVQ